MKNKFIGFHGNGCSHRFEFMVIHDNDQDCTNDDDDDEDDQGNDNDRGLLFRSSTADPEMSALRPPGSKV